MLGDVIALGKRHGFDVKTVIRLDIAPGEAILSEAARARANFLVIGANRRVGESLVLGKTVSLLLERWNGDLVILAI